MNAYAAGIIVELYGNEPLTHCYNSGIITASKQVDSIHGKAVYSSVQVSHNCLNAGSVNAPSKTPISGGTNLNSYYYDGTTL